MADSLPRLRYRILFRKSRQAMIEYLLQQGAAQHGVQPTRPVAEVEHQF